MTQTLADPWTVPVPPEDARSRLVWAASTLVHAESYHSVGVKAICDLAGVQRGSFYHYFHSKQALILEAVDAMWDRFERDALAWCRDMSLAPRQRLEAHIGYLHSCHEHEKARTGQVLGCSFGNLGAESGGVGVKVRERLSDIFEAWAHALEGPLAEAQTLGEIDRSLKPRDLARETLATIQGLILMSKVRNDPAIVLDGGSCMTNRLWGYSDAAPA